MTSRRRLFDPLPRFGAGEGGDPSRSDGEGEGYAAPALEMASPGDRRFAPVATLSRSKARERGIEPALLHLSRGRGKKGEPAGGVLLAIGRHAGSCQALIQRPSPTDLSLSRA